MTVREHDAGVNCVDMSLPPHERESGQSKQKKRAIHPDDKAVHLNERDRERSI